MINSVKSAAATIDKAASNATVNVAPKYNNAIEITERKVIIRCARASSWRTSRIFCFENFFKNFFTFISLDIVNNSRLSC